MDRTRDSPGEFQWPWLTRREFNSEWADPALPRKTLRGGCAKASQIVIPKARPDLCRHDLVAANGEDLLLPYHNSEACSRSFTRFDAPCTIARSNAPLKALVRSAAGILLLFTQYLLLFRGRTDARAASRPDPSQSFSGVWRGCYRRANFGLDSLQASSWTTPWVLIRSRSRQIRSTDRESAASTVIPAAFTQLRSAHRRHEPTQTSTGRRERLSSWGRQPRWRSRKLAWASSASLDSGRSNLYQKACGRASKTIRRASTPARRSAR